MFTLAGKTRKLSRFHRPPGSVPAAAATDSLHRDFRREIRAGDKSVTGPVRVVSGEGGACAAVYIFARLRKLSWTLTAKVTRISAHRRAPLESIESLNLAVWGQLATQAKFSDKRVHDTSCWLERSVAQSAWALICEYCTFGTRLAAHHPASPIWASPQWVPHQSPGDGSRDAQPLWASLWSLPFCLG